MEVLKYRVDGTSEWKDIIGLQGKPGKPFTYEDFTEEQLEALTGPEGPAGANGKDGYTPVKGEDYWTEQDQQSIKSDLESYIDEQLGVIENGTY